MEALKEVSSKTRDEVPRRIEDPRWRKVNRIMRLHGYRPSALIETLHMVQDTFGFLETDALILVAKTLRVPLSRVYAVATFYHFFTLKPPGKHTCVVCMCTACYISGAADIINSMQQALNIEPGETTADGAISLLTARCLGSCGLAPAVVFDGVVEGKLIPSVVLEKIERWKNDDA
ncbi:MAG: bidirectional hydrogenase complex protein HoxE [Desulfosarcina sp.]|nr:bidirectional hydrogenase complex protein HoxE [Desulfobacterales bacterium]